MDSSPGDEHNNNSDEEALLPASNGNFFGDHDHDDDLVFVQMTNPATRDAVRYGTELMSWAYTGLLDLVRRLTLGASKFVCNSLLFIVALESLSAIRIRTLDDYPYPTIMVTGLILGLIEPGLSAFPISNKKYLPILNGFFLSLENILLKSFTFCILYCGYHPVPHVPNRYLPDKDCIASHRGEILLLVGLFMPLHILLGIKEYYKYHTKTPPQLTHNVYVTTGLKYFSTFVISMLSLISLITTISTITEIKFEKSVPISVELGLSGSLGFLMTLAYSMKRLPHPELREKAYYITCEFLKPMLGNYYASVYFTGTVFPFYTGVSMKKLSGGMLLTVELMSYALTILLCFIRVKDAIWYKFNMPKSSTTAHTNTSFFSPASPIRPAHNTSNPSTAENERNNSSSPTARALTPVHGGSSE